MGAANASALRCADLGGRALRQAVRRRPGAPLLAQMFGQDTGRRTQDACRGVGVEGDQLFQRVQPASPAQLPVMRQAQKEHGQPWPRVSRKPRATGPRLDRPALSPPLPTAHCPLPTASTGTHSRCCMVPAKVFFQCFATRANA